MQSRLMWVAVAAISMLLVGSIATAQQDDTPVKDAIEAMRQSLVDGDAEAMGGLLSDTGFVAVVPDETGTQCMDKEALLEGFGGEANGMNVEFADTEVKLYWMVATAKTTVNVPEMGMELTLSTVLMREAGEWKFVSLSVIIPDPQPTDEAVAEAGEIMTALPEAMMENDVAALEEALSDENFVLAYVDPSYEVRWAGEKGQFVEMIRQVKDMVTITNNHFEPTETLLSQDVAVITGTWVLDIPDLGESKSDLIGTAIKTEAGWKIVGLAGGPEG